MAVKEIQFDYDYTDSNQIISQSGLDEAHTRLDSFRRECDLLSSLSHPSLVRFLGADERTPKLLCLFTELCTAGTLADIAKYQPGEDVVRRMGRDLARAVAYLHERGIVHRDIKPENIFLIDSPSTIISNSATAVVTTPFPIQTRSDAGNNISATSNHSAATSPPNHHHVITQSPSRQRPILKLGDFSHSLRLHSISNTVHGTVGTARYMAPEVCRNQSDGYGRPCDIWSYSCVLLYLLTGKPPWFQYNNRDAIYYQLGHNRLPIFPRPLQATPFRPEVQFNHETIPSTEVMHASPEACTLLEAGINADPGSRPTAPQLLHFDFLQCPD